MSTSLILDAIGALCVFGAVIALGFARTSNRIQSIDERLSHYAQSGAGLAINMPTEDAPDKWTIVGILKRLRSHEKTTRPGLTASKVVEALARADLKLRPAEWRLIRIGSIALLVLVGLAVYRSLVYAAILGVVGFFLPIFVLKFRARKRTRAFNNQLGDVLLLLSNGLKAGYSFPQAMGSIAKSANPPVADEFARATREIQLGVSSDDALGHMVARINSEDLDLVVTAVGIQRVVGGNLAEILDSIAFTIRERIRIKGEVRTLTAQARMSSYIITALPIGLALILQAINPSYIAPLLSFQGPGPFILMGCAASIGAAFFIMQKISGIEV